MRTYSELIKLPTWQQRLEYCRTRGTVGHETYGSERYLCQAFYQSDAWRRFRDKIIVRDRGMDLGVDGYDISGTIVIHHIEPLSPYDMIERTSRLMDPENVICVSHATHNAIHYGAETPAEWQPRRENDTCPWRNP